MWEYKMQQIKNYSTSEILYQASCTDGKLCLEKAVTEGVIIDGAVFHSEDYRDGMFDDAYFINTHFINCNLTGANLSEAVFINCFFYSCSLQAACLNESRIDNCAFIQTRFGDTDFAGSKLSGCIFEDPSVFSLNFHEIDLRLPCFYRHTNGNSYAMSRPPVIVRGLSHPLIFLDTHILTGADAYQITADTIRCIARDLCSMLTSSLFRNAPETSSGKL